MSIKTQPRISADEYAEEQEHLYKERTKAILRQINRDSQPVVTGRGLLRFFGWCLAGALFLWVLMFIRAIDW